MYVSFVTTGKIGIGLLIPHRVINFTASNSMPIRGNLLGRFLYGSVRLEFGHFSLHTIQVVWKVSAFEFRHLLVDPFQQIWDQPFVIILHSLILQQSSYHLMDIRDIIKSNYSFANFFPVLYLFGNRSYIHNTGITTVRCGKKIPTKFIKTLLLKFYNQNRYKNVINIVFYTCMMNHWETLPFRFFCLLFVLTSSWRSNGSRRLRMSWWICHPVLVRPHLQHSQINKRLSFHFFC